MALMAWDDEEDKKKDDLLNVTPIKQIASVQSGAWQPAPSGADSAVATDDVTQGGIFGQQQPQQPEPVQTENYLVSDQKAQVDQQKRQRDAEIEAARAEQAAARERAEAAAAVSQQFQEGNVTDNQGQKLNVEEIKRDEGWKKYYKEEFEREKKGLDFWGRLMDGGQASRRAETMARNRYNGELIRKAWGDNGELLDPNAAMQAKKLAAYNSALAEDNSNRSMVLARAIGATKDNQGEGFWNRVKNAINAEKQMNIYDAIVGADDSQKTDINDLGRFGGGLLQGFATMPVIGGKELYESARGRGTDAQTGFEDDLTAGERVGRGVSGGLNVVTPFVGGSGKFLDSLTTKVLSNTATAAEKTLLKRMTSQILLPAIEQGAIGATQAGAEYFGNGNSLLDENGEFDKDKLAEFAKQVGEAGAVGTAGGVVLGGAGMGIKNLRSRNRDIPTLDAGELAALELNTTNAGEAQLSANRMADAEGASLQALENGDVTPVQPVADGVVTADAPADTAPTDSNVPFETPDTTPVADGVPTDVTPVGATPTVTRDSIVTGDTPTADGTVTTMPAEVTPVRDSVIDAPVDVPVARDPEAMPADVVPVADGVPQQMDSVAPVRTDNMPVVGADEVRALQESRIGKNQAEEAAINQQLAEAEANTPSTDSLPDDMSQGSEIVNPTELTRAQVAERLMPKLADNSDVKARIAEAVDMGKDTASPIRDILRDGNVKPRQAERVATQFEKLEQQLMEYNRLEEMNQRAYAEGGVDALDENVSRERSRAAREMGITTRRLMQEIKRMEGSRDFKTRLINNLTDAIGTRNASVLTSAGLLERNVAQELTANLKLAAKNPIKMAKSTFMNGNILKDTARSELSHWADAPRNPIEAVKYVVGNTYRTAMIPTTALANTRRGAVRDELTRWAFQELEGRKVSAREAHRLSGTAGNEMEALVNTFIGVDNGMTNRKQATDALKAWKEYIRTGDDGAKTQFLEKVEQHNSLADQMIAGLSKEDAVRARGLMAVKNLIFPFVRTATNLAKNTVRQDLNPFAKSLLDEIRVDQRSGATNAINLVKSKLVDYGIMSGAAALASSGMLVYNDGDEVDKPKGWSLKIGDNKYIPVRSTSLELPIAMAGTAQKMASDIADGNPREWQYYAGMVTNSLPYIDQFNTTTGAVDSAMGMGSDSGDNGYAAKSYGVNMIKSFVPFSNNGIQPYVAGKQGESLNAKSVYDKDFGTWLQNSIMKSYDPDFYNSLKDSRDNAGRVRTVDNQGVVSNKTINDANTAEFNDRITDLVNFGRENGLGKNTQDMFNSYDTGKNNNFKSVQDSITFLDVEDGQKPDNAKKLEKNAKLTDLSRQIRDGFYGDSGMELLTLDGQNLKSDVSMPNTAGTKNSKMPLSMQTIKNAVAQTDLPKEDSDALYAISNQSTELYNQLKAKNISYEQYSAAKAKLGQQEIDILSNSKNYQRMLTLFDELDQTGFFDADGLGSTKSGQTYLWNSLNALLGSKGATPAANYPDSDKNKGFMPWGNRGTGRSANAGGKLEGNKGIEWTPVRARQMAGVTAGKYTPVNISVKLNSQIKKDRSQNYSDRSF